MDDENTLVEETISESSDSSLSESEDNEPLRIIYYYVVLYLLIKSAAYKYLREVVIKLI